MTTMERVLGNTYKVIGIDTLPLLHSKFTAYKGSIGIDLETTGLNFLTDKIVTMQFGTEKHQYILDCRPYYALGTSEQQQWKDCICRFLQGCSQLVFHNGKFDLKFLSYHFNVRLLQVADTMIQELVLYGVGMGGAEDNGIKVNMLDTATRYRLHVEKELQLWSVNLDKPRNFYPDNSYSFLVTSKTGKLKLVYWYPNHTAYKEGCTPVDLTVVRVSTEQWTAPLPETFLAYDAQDVYIPLQIHTQQQKALAAKGLVNTVAIENACMPAIARMEVDGCFIDRPKWAAINERKRLQRIALGTELEEILTPYIQQHRQRQFDLQVKAFNQWKNAQATILAQLEAKFQEQSVNVPFPQGTKRIVILEDKTGLTWAAFKKYGMAAFKETMPRPATPKLVTGAINLGSHTQLIIALAGLDVHVESTDKEHLEAYATRVPAVKKLLVWKNLDKFLNAFGDSFLEKIQADGRIHPTYNQVGAATGRMSCSTPNWQQIPSHFDSDDDNVRMCVIGENNNVMLTADLDNIEYRILTDISKDAALISFFSKVGGDLHSATARLMFNLSEDSNPKKMDIKPGLTYRSVAKTINYGLVYGMSPVKLARTLGVTKEEATELFEKYFTAYSGVAKYLEESSATALEKGYSETLSGRKRFYDVLSTPVFDRDTMSWETFKELKSEVSKTNGSYGRQAKNAPIQGTNADITKYALALLYRHLPLNVKIAAAVHDEIVLECAPEDAEATAAILAKAMHKACRKFLHTVFIPDTEVAIEKYWKKG
jgi:DNA polymerase-1